MTREDAIAQLQQPYRESVLLDGLDDALIGYIDSGHHQPRALYDLERCVELIRQRLGWTFPAAGDVLRGALTNGWWPAAGMPAFAVLVNEPQPISFSARIEEAPQ
ncbi:MAG TPA: hypothetical protein VGP72_27660 [Planctomycetota bacterium]|jgi:hypothetical protein